VINPAPLNRHPIVMLAVAGVLLATPLGLLAVLGVR
jgi:hypothetical protein